MNANAKHRRDTPNILFIMTDQQRYDMLGANEGAPCLTPNLDALAAEGFRFTHAYSVCGLCSPARASMLTGLCPHTHHMWNNQDMIQWARRELPDDVQMISQHLDRAGYRCGYAGKWHCGSEKLPSHYSFVGLDVPGYGDPYKTSEYRDYARSKGLAEREIEYEYRDQTTAREPLVGTMVSDPRAGSPAFLAAFTIELIDQFERLRARDGRPWFMFLSFWAPHHPYFPPQQYLDMYDLEDVPIWPNFHDDLRGKPPHQDRFRHSFHTMAHLSEEQWRDVIRHNFAQMTYVDAEIGRLLDALKERGLYEDLAILFGTDHGDMCGAHGQLFDKGPYMYEDTYRLPLIIRWPQVGTQGTIVNEFVTNMDMAPTVLEMAGVQIPANMEGRSLCPLLLGDKADWPDDVMAEFHGHRYLFSQRMVRWAHYKFIFNASSFDEFYDLDHDPHELDNKISQSSCRPLIQEGKERLLKWMEKTEDPLSYTADKMLH